MFFQPLFKCYITSYISTTFRNPPMMFPNRTFPEKGCVQSPFLLNFSRMSAIVLLQWESYCVFKVCENPVRSDPSVFGAVVCGALVDTGTAGMMPLTLRWMRKFPYCSNLIDSHWLPYTELLWVSPFMYFLKTKQCNLGIMAFSVFCFELWLLL